MEKLIKKYLIFFLAAVVFLQTNISGASGFFSGVVKTQKIISMGSVSVAIENLNNDTKTLRANNSQNFSFALSNTGKSDIDYSLDIQIAWDDELSEAGRLFVYHSETSDAEIYENLKQGDFSGAVIGMVSDGKQVQGSQSVSLGICETVDSSFLQAADKIKQGVTGTKDYSLKLFFFEDEEINLNPSRFDGKILELGIVVRFGVRGFKTGWATTEKSFVCYKTIVDTQPPVISEIALPKTFFVTQTADLDLKAYAAAFDSSDGDISEKIEISSVPKFINQKAGVYQVTYNVANSRGIHAMPLTITIVVWDFVKIEAGNYHVLALTSHGKVYSWGNNYYGQLGDGTNKEKTTPKLVEDLDDIVDIAAGRDCSFAISSDGQAYSWGLNANGRLGDNTTVNRNKPVKVLQPDGVHFVQIAASNGAAAVTSEGDVYTWGYGAYGALGDGGTNDCHMPARINLSNIVKVSINKYNGAAITNEGKLFTWGYGGYGALGNGSSAGTVSLPGLIQYFDDLNIKIKDISVGHNTIAAVSHTGQLFTWGYGGDGQLGDGGINSKHTPQLILLAVNAVKATVSDDYAAVMTEEGTVFFFGANGYGQHGSGDTQAHLTPKLLAGVFGATDICLAANTSFVLSDSQVVYAMGYGRTGELGNEIKEDSKIPVLWKFNPPLPY